jgi:hypothetical protein
VCITGRGFEEACGRELMVRNNRAEIKVDRSLAVLLFVTERLSQKVLVALGRL